MKRIVAYFFSIIVFILSLFFLLFTVALFLSEDMDLFGVIFFLILFLCSLFFSIFLKSKADSLKSKSIDVSSSLPKDSVHRRDFKSTNDIIQDMFSDSRISEIDKTSEKQNKKFELTIPSVKDGCPIAYKYNGCEIEELNYDSVLSFATNNKYELSVKILDGKPYFYCEDSMIGTISGNISNMLIDWLSNKEPFFVCIEGIDTTLRKAYAFIVFYRDKRKKMSYREQSVVRLTNYRGEDSQMIIMQLNEGVELFLSEDYDISSDKDFVSVSESCVDIGRLPKKISEKYFEEGCAGCFFDKSEYDDVKDIYIPYVRIYW